MSLPTLHPRTTVGNGAIPPGLDRLTAGLKGHVRTIRRQRPPEPCTDELHYYDIPMSAWRRALEEWCTRMGREGRYASSWLRGLQSAIRDFDEHELLILVEQLGR